MKTKFFVLNTPSGNEGIGVSESGQFDDNAEISMAFARIVDKIYEKLSTHKLISVEVIVNGETLLTLKEDDEN